MGSKMEAQILDNPEPTEQVLSILTQHLPYSLPTLRRLQFMKLDTRSPSNQHVLSTFDRNAPGKDFLVAYLNFDIGPEVEMWMYSSIENPDTPGDDSVCEEQILALFKRASELEKTYQGQRETPGVLLVGSLHKIIVEILEKHSMVKDKTEEHFKFIIKTDELPFAQPLPETLSYSTMRPSDISLVLSRTAIPYKAFVTLH